jgi:hypothetical protein
VSPTREPVPLLIDFYKQTPECDRKLKDATEEFNRINLCKSDSDCTFLGGFLPGCDAVNAKMPRERLGSLLQDEVCGFYAGFCVGIFVRCDRGRCIRSNGDAGIRIKNPHLYDPDEDDLVRKRD